MSPLIFFYHTSLEGASELSLLADLTSNSFQVWRVMSVLRVVQPLTVDSLWTPKWAYPEEGECLFHRSGACCLLPAVNRPGNEQVTFL